MQPMINRRTVIFLLALAALHAAAGTAFAKDSDGGGGDSGGGGDGGGGDSGGGDSGGGNDSGGGDDSDNDSGGDNKRDSGGDSKRDSSGSNRDSGGDDKRDKARRRSKGDEERIRDAVSKGDATPLRDILKTVSRDYPGEVLRVRLKGKNEDLQYRIRILQPGGRRVDVDVDARSGRIIKAD